MPLPPGSRLGAYEVVSLLGAGGMGEVYRARDPRLGRDVAIKVLPGELARDELRRRRFLQEARACSALNHPAIVAIHELESADGVDVIVMEHVKGQTLQALIRSGLKLGDTLRIAIAVADALAAAHAAGIVHRDLKPANVMVTPEGAVKVLDFGLAKLADPSGGSEDDSTLSEVERPVTLSRAGTIAGTPGYMSPEQATGRKLDARSDVFAFGSLLYEMVTGRRAFQGTTREETLRAVTEQPVRPPSEAAAGIPEPLEKLILRCLRKEPERRFQYMSDVRVELEEIEEESDSAARGQPPARRARRRTWLIAALVVAVVALSASWVTWRSIRRLPPPRLVPVTSYGGAELHPALSPDGEQVAFSWEGWGDTGGLRPTRHIWIQLVGESESRQLTSGPANDCCPSWSRDGRQIAFLRSATSASAEVHLVSPVGGAERKLGDFPARSSQIAWTADGEGILAPRSGVGSEDDPASGAIHVLSVSGQPPRILGRPVKGGHDRSPSVSPDGRRLAYASCRPSVIASLAPCNLEVVSLDGGRPTTVRTVTTTKVVIDGLAWAPDGRSLIYSLFRGPGYLWRVGTSGDEPPERLDLSGANAAWPSISAHRSRLAYTSAQGAGQIHALDAAGGRRPMSFSSAGEEGPSFSPDGRRIAFLSNRNGETAEIWLAEADGSSPVQLTHGPGYWQAQPRWSPDGRRVVFHSHGDDGYAHVWTIEVAGGSPRRMTHGGQLQEGGGAWSPDGRFIYYREDRADGSDICRVPDAGGSSERVTTSGGANPLPLADGRTLLYTRQRGPSPLVARDLEHGTEEEIVDCVNGRDFDAVGGNVYYVGCPGRERDMPLFRVDQRTRRRQLLGMVRNSSENGIAASPLGWPILYTEFTGQADLMLIENFR